MGFGDIWVGYGNFHPNQYLFTPNDVFAFIGTQLFCWRDCELFLCSFHTKSLPDFFFSSMCHSPENPYPNPTHIQFNFRYFPSATNSTSYRRRHIQVYPSVNYFYASKKFLRRYETFFPVSYIFANVQHNQFHIQFKANERHFAEVYYTARLCEWGIVLQFQRKHKKASFYWTWWTYIKMVKCWT